MDILRTIEGLCEAYNGVTEGYTLGKSGLCEPPLVTPLLNIIVSCFGTPPQNRARISSPTTLEVGHVRRKARY